MARPMAVPVHTHSRSLQMKGDRKMRDNASGCRYLLEDSASIDWPFHSRDSIAQPAGMNLCQRRDLLPLCLKCSSQLTNAHSRGSASITGATP